METKRHPHETVLETYQYNGISVELVQWDAAVWCGSLEYAVNNTDEPDVETALHRFMALSPDAVRKAEEAWDTCISLNYLCEVRPRGVMFAVLAASDAVPEGCDVLHTPASLYMRITPDEETAAAVGEQPWEGGIPPYQWIGEKIAPLFGYTYGDDTLPVVEYYGNYDPKTNVHQYRHLYVPVKKYNNSEGISMFTTAIYGESLVKTICHNGISMELVQVPATIWCGSIAFADNLTDEPDIPALLANYQANCPHPKQHRANPEWDNCISIDYWQEGKVPRGMMFSQQVTDDEQDPVHDIYRMPRSLYIRLICNSETARAAFGRAECGVWELFGVIKDTLEPLGYHFAGNGAQEIEMYNHGAGLAYAYVPVEAAKE